MNLIAQLCPVADILLARDIANKNRLFDVVAQHFEQRHGLAASSTLAAMREREELGSTALGDGLAVPHGRIAGLQQLVAVFVRPKTAIAFDAPDQKPVSDVLALLVPEDAVQEHLLVLADIARLFSDRSFRHQLQLCGSATEVNQLFSDWSGAHANT